MNGNSVSPFAAAVILLGAAAAGVLGVVLWNATQDEGMVIAGAPGTVLADPTPAPAQFGPTVAPGLPQPTPVPPPGQAPAETAVPDAPTSPIQFDEALIADAIAQGGANPLVGLPTRNVVATELLIAQFTSAGIDLTGIEFIVYPESAVPSFVLMTTSDSTPLLGLDGGADEPHPRRSYRSCSSRRCSTDSPSRS